MFKRAKCKFPTERYNIDTSNVVESQNGFFLTRYDLLPMIDAILLKIGEWFNKHMKEIYFVTRT